MGTCFAFEPLWAIVSHCGQFSDCNDAAENDMKIYLLLALIGILLAAIRFTSVPEQQSKTLPQ
jgi:hypothetical protein